jgi:hypothetical protein
MLVFALLGVGAASVEWLQPASAAQAARSSRAIRTVLASRHGSDFRYFPHYVGTARCTIPFAMTRGIKGTCSSRVSPRRGYSGQTTVTLYERWPWHAFHHSGTPRRTLHHRWVFVVLPSGKVIFVRQGGDFAPNFAY